jgi:Zn-dependent peptidase ImmA (M78 family)/transcriptional regulator with XRE-family HTH domain
MKMAASRVFSGGRLRLARLFAGLSQKELGEFAGVTHASVSQAENCVKQPSSHAVEAFATAVGCLPKFFYRPEMQELREDECHFRHRKTTPVSAKTRVLSTGSIFCELAAVIGSTVLLPPYEVPCIRVTDLESIEKAAEHCRMAWGLGLDVPISSIIRALESRAGVVIGRFSAETPKVDAFSWAKTRGMIVLNTDNTSTSRLRFDCAHECGHLVMHAGLHPEDTDLETQADRFASAFLMPRAGFVREVPRFGSGRVRLEDLIPMKRRWRTSIAAIVRRSYDLRLIDAVQYQGAMKQYYARHWHKGEPEEPDAEHPETLKLAFNVMAEHYGQDYSAIATDLGWLPETLSRVVPDVAAVALRKDVKQPQPTAPVITLAQYRHARGLG